MTVETQHFQLVNQDTRRGHHWGRHIYPGWKKEAEILVEASQAAMNHKDLPSMGGINRKHWIKTAS